MFFTPPQLNLDRNHEVVENVNNPKENFACLIVSVVIMQMLYKNLQNTSLINFLKFQQKNEKKREGKC
jgi:hypothetical protein